MSNNNYEELLTVKEVQQLLGIGKNTAYDLVRQKKIKCFRIGKLWKVPKRAIEEYITTQSNVVQEDSTKLKGGV
ncbi:MAG: helix-turn-helix domain-containing protein [Lachnospiraceae bacterium]|nr:helix-turn-helix domain-containing protein [Lachnospiraceae bacterium]